MSYRVVGRVVLELVGELHQPCDRHGVFEVAVAEVTHEAGHPLPNIRTEKLHVEGSERVPSRRRFALGLRPLRLRNHQPGHLGYDLRYGSVFGRSQLCDIRSMAANSYSWTFLPRAIVAMLRNLEFLATQSVAGHGHCHHLTPVVQYGDCVDTT